MNRRSGNLGNFLMTLLLLVIGGGLIYGNLINREMGDLLRDMLAIPLVGAALGMVLILSVVLRWVGTFKRKKTGYIDFEAEDGSVGISTKAIQDFIERVGKEFAAVKSIESRLQQKKGALDIAINVRVASGNKIPALSQLLQQRVRESVHESLGLDNIRNITIKVREIIGEPVKSATESDE